MERRGRLQDEVEFNSVLSGSGTCVERTQIVRGVPSRQAVFECQWQYRVDDVSKRKWEWMVMKKKNPEI